MAATPRLCGRHAQLPVKTFSLAENHPYFLACRRKDLEALKKYWNQGISVYADSDTKHDLLGQAFELRDYDLMRFVLRNGYQVDHPTGIGQRSALMYAIGQDDPELINFFLREGADINFADKYGFTPYLMSLFTSSETRRLILDRNPNQSVKDFQGHDAFSLVCSEGLLEMMESLLNEGADINTRNIAGKTPLIRAAGGGKKEVCEWLLRAGADVHLVDKRRRTALDHARANGHTEVTTLLEVLLSQE